jgi:diguanylate cyclase (GGDEF)-like protein
MMLDVDHFKAVNDNHGHSVGDDVLRVMGELMHNFIGDRGLVCRYGGEEFVVLVPEVSIEDAMDLAEELRASIEANDETNVRFTASIGVSSRNFGSMDAQHMLDQADESLYTAKRHGRNMVANSLFGSHWAPVSVIVPLQCYGSTFATCC